MDHLLRGNSHQSPQHSDKNLRGLLIKFGTTRRNYYRFLYNFSWTLPFYLYCDIIYIPIINQSWSGLNCDTSYSSKLFSRCNLNNLKPQITVWHNNMSVLTQALFHHGIKNLGHSDRLCDDSLKLTITYVSKLYLSNAWSNVLISTWILGGSGVRPSQKTDSSS